MERNKKKEKSIIKKLSDEEIMMNVIETGGSLYDYICRSFPDYIEDHDEETEEQFQYRRSMEDLFRKKKKEWRESIL